MTIRVLADDRQWKELTGMNTELPWHRCADEKDFRQETGADAFFNLLPTAGKMDYSFTAKPVFIHLITETLKEIGNPKNVLRINAWNGFLDRSIWEIAGSMNDESRLVLSTLNKKAAEVDDEPGLIAARVIAMIVNEAYYALQDGISTKAEIDTAMKLGTNYPHGPFEWSNTIGLRNILELLDALAVVDKRYQASELLRTEAESIHS